MPKARTSIAPYHAIRDPLRDRNLTDLVIRLDEAIWPYWGKQKTKVQRRTSKEEIMLLFVKIYNSIVDGTFEPGSYIDKAPLVAIAKEAADVLRTPRSKTKPNGNGKTTTRGRREIDTPKDLARLSKILSSRNAVVTLRVDRGSVVLTAQPDEVVVIADSAARALNDLLGKWGK